MATCRKCRGDISFVVSLKDRWLPVSDTYDVLEPRPGELVAMYLDGEWTQIDVKAVRVFSPHECRPLATGTVALRRVEPDPEPLEVEPEPEPVVDLSLYPADQLGHACSQCSVPRGWPCIRADGTTMPRPHTTRPRAGFRAEGPVYATEPGGKQLRTWLFDYSDILTGEVL